MDKEFNKIIVDIVLSFIEQHSLLGEKPSTSLMNNQKKYIFGNQSYGSSLSSVTKDRVNFDIFAPISSFNYYGKNYLIKFNHDWNKKIFTIFLNRFLNTSYEHLFFSTITKIVPINFCIENEPWLIVKNFLCVKPRKINGLPSPEDMKHFFMILNNYIAQPDFNDCLFKFCQHNTSFIKRIEAQEYLKNLLLKIDNCEEFSIFLQHTNDTLTTEKNDFVTFYINKKLLFSKFSDIAINKQQPVTMLNNILSSINYHKPDYSNIEQLFVEQKDDKYSELIVLVRFKEKTNYSFENYYLYLLNFFINNKVEISKNLANVSCNFFMNLKYAEKKHNTKQKTAKI